MEITGETGDSRSATLMVHLLGECNLTCRHCYMHGSPARRDRLPLDWVLRAIDECAGLGVAALYLTGGEPLLYPDLEEVLRRAATVGDLRTTLCTNGTLVTTRWAGLLRELGVTVNVSIDGDATFHDYFRDLRGSFGSAEAGLQLLVKAGVPVTVVITVSRANAHILCSVAEWAAAAGVVQLRVQPLLRLGRGLGISEMRLTKDGMDRLLLQLTDLANVYGPRGMKCNLIGASRSFLRKHPCGAYVRNGVGCHRRVEKEIKKVVVREDGTILPEVTNLSRRFAIGTIHGGSLSDLTARFFEDGYADFDRLCRTVYSEVLPGWDSEFVPWDELVAERSRAWRHLPLAPAPLAQGNVPSCGQDVLAACMAETSS